MLGNLSPERIAENLSVEFNKTTLRTLEESRQEDVSKKIEPGKWHCFDLPFVMVCGDMETAQNIYNLLLPYQDKMKGSMQITIEG